MSDALELIDKSLATNSVTCSDASSSRSTSPAFVSNRRNTPNDCPDVPDRATCRRRYALIVRLTRSNTASLHPKPCRVAKGGAGAGRFVGGSAAAGREERVRHAAVKRVRGCLMLWGVVGRMVRRRNKVVSRRNRMEISSAVARADDMLGVVMAAQADTGGWRYRARDCVCMYVGTGMYVCMYERDEGRLSVEDRRLTTAPVLKSGTDGSYETCTDVHYMAQLFLPHRAGETPGLT